MLHVGLGESQLNNLLAAANIPCISSSGLKKRENEAGAALDTYAEESMSKHLEIESNLEKEAGLFTHKANCWSIKCSF